MRVLFIDTETTGLPSEWISATHSDQARVVQLGALLFLDRSEIASIDLVVNNGRPIPEAAAKIHGITTEIAEAVGIAAQGAAGILWRLVQQADLVVAHNASFDIRMLCIMAEQGLVTGLAKALQSKPVRCTCEAAAPIVNLPPTERMVTAGINKPKPPKLEECVRHFFGEELTGAHSAMVDVRACARVYWKLEELGAWREAA